MLRVSFCGLILFFLHFSAFSQTSPTEEIDQSFEYSTVAKSEKNEKIKKENPSPNHKKVDPRNPLSQLKKQDRQRVVKIIKRAELAITILMFSVIPLVLIVLVSLYFIFQQSGFPGWAAFVPIYNFYIFVKVIKKPTYWAGIWSLPIIFNGIEWIIGQHAWFIFLGATASITSFIFHIFGMSALADIYKKNTRFKVGLVLLPFIYFPILAFKSNISKKSTSEKNQTLT